MDILPEAPTPVETVVPANPPPLVRRVILHVHDHFVSAVNSFRLFRDYPDRPSYDPDAFIKITELSNVVPHSSETLVAAASTQSEPLRPSAPWPFANMSIFRLMSFFNSGGTMKSASEANWLVNEVLLTPDFKPEDLIGFDARRESKKLDNALEKEAKTRHLQNFTETSIDIDIPSGNKSVPSSKFTVPGLLYQKITSVIRAAFHDPLAHHIHLSPFRLKYRNHVTGIEERVLGEVYTSDAFLEEHNKVRLHSPLPPDDPSCQREKVVAAIMFSSDATHLTNFGIAKAWPIYLMLGNLSKYIRAQPNSGAMHHLAYIPSVRDFYCSHFLQYS